MHTPTVEENGWTCSHSVVEVVTDDMPFLVDSVTNELTRQGRGIHVVIHPQFVVRRDVTGKLIEVLPDPVGGDLPQDARDLPHDAHVESWIHVEIDRETDRGDLKQITADLLRVLSDVREAVEDWGKMRQAATSLADALPDEPMPADLPPLQVEEARELLHWLADDHFTFLGYREYELRADDSLAAVPGTGLGILRSDPHHATDEEHPVSPSFERLPADARAKAREHKLLILTKANSRATVHRPSYLDYIGVKKFDADGNVIGERRFLGLFSSAAYTESVRRVPVIRRKVEDVLERAGFSPHSHDGRDLLQILETYPRDELFQTPVEELQAIATSVLYLQERRRLRLYLRQDEYGRYYSALVYLPRDRYTTAVRLRIIDILKEELGGVSVDFTAWNTESVLSRLHFVVRVPQGTELRHLSDSDKERLESRLAEAARSWSDGFSEALTTEFGEERAAELLRRYGAPSPRATRPTTARAAPWPTWCAWRSSASSTTSRSACTSRWARRPTSAASRSTAPARPSPCPRCCPCCSAWASRSSTSGRTSCGATTAASPTSTTSGCACRRRPAAGWTTSATTPASASRTPSRRPGPARRRTTASTPSC